MRLKQPYKLFKHTEINSQTFYTDLIIFNKLFHLASIQIYYVKQVKQFLRAFLEIYYNLELC